MANKPDFIILGPPKAATTWVYECLKEHPEVYMPETDQISYFNINYHKGEEWYLEHFEEAEESQVVGEESLLYIKNVKAPERIAKDYEDVKLIFILRNPIDRAFSHYWHEKKKDKIKYSFDQILEIHDLFESWAVTGFYYTHIQRYLEHFDRDQMKIMIFDDLVENDEEFISEIFEFVDVDPEYRPSFLDDKVNEAGVEWMKPYKLGKEFLKRNLSERQIKALMPVHKGFKGLFASKSEYEKGMDDEIRTELEKVFEEEVDELSRFLDRDLSHWVDN